MWSVQILRCLLREFCLVVWVFFFSECLAHCNPQTCGYLCCIGIISDLCILASFISQQYFSVQIQGFKPICKNGFKLAECENWTSSHCRFRIAYCISLDASTACAVHILDFIKIKKLNCTVYSFVKRHSWFMSSVAPAVSFMCSSGSRWL